MSKCGSHFVPPLYQWQLIVLLSQTFGVWTTNAHLGSLWASMGQAINRQKTTLFFSPNTRPNLREEIYPIFGAQIIFDFEKYLGLLMVGSKNKVNTFKELHEWIAKRVTGWKKKYISKTGREILIKTVAQAIPT